MTYRTFVTTLACATCAAQIAAAETAVSDLIGTWQTPAIAQPAPDGGTAWLRSTTVFTETSQQLIVEIYADQDLQAPLFAYRSGGPMDPQGPAAGVAGALAINLKNDYSLVEIYVDAPDLWAAVSLAECPLTIGQAVDITDCVTGPPFGVTGCVDLDIVMVDQDRQRLRYGSGSDDRCTTRPTELSADAFERMQ